MQVPDDFDSGAGKPVAAGALFVGVFIAFILLLPIYLILIAFLR